MNFAACVMRPGQVLVSYSNGTIKASAPALFSEKDIDKLPPIYPFIQTHSNSFSQPNIGDEVWVINVANNPRQLYWMRKDDLEFNEDIMGDIIESGDSQNREIIVDRELDGGINRALLYYSDNTGWKMFNRDSGITIQDSNIKIGDETDGNYINISPTTISLGSLEASHPVAFGDNIQDILMDIYNILKNIEEVAAKSPYTTGIGAAITSKIDSIGNKIDVCLSDKIMID